MWFLIAGLLLLLMKFAEFGPVANWSWLVVLAPFVLAVLWWNFADAVGLPQKWAMQKMEDRKAERRSRDLVSLGIDAKRDRQVQRARETARRVANDAPPAPAPKPPLKLDAEGAPPPRKEPRL
jgi:small Trp-rich protein